MCPPEAGTDAAWITILRAVPDRQHNAMTLTVAEALSANHAAGLPRPLQAVSTG
jgi:hypothetical protein